MPPRPPSLRSHADESHRSHRAGWLRAGVLGANDGIVSTASLMMGVAAADGSSSAVATAGLAGLVGGALSMAVGEYVSVSSQRDAERADLEKERSELRDFPDAELRELTEIYIRRGLDRGLAGEVASQLHAHDALGAHLRDELNLVPEDLARPSLASWVSAIAFACGSVVPLLAGVLTDGGTRVWLVGLVAIVALVVLGVVGARLGGAGGRRAAARVVAGGGLAMAATATIGAAVGSIG